ncbi:flagellar export protein FliJ [Pandoraea terrae]|uniref:Flagellar FliJ protein n=1 Tax=Pandoraea terrae TaxID=1537710 RepID=A0A5E4YFP6_9BURK|nr:flagellar export protein FliJ [Pandoraea terrae]VVE47561.1 flagellar export protein FliJ [Pandoraea terrae]
MNSHLPLKLLIELAQKDVDEAAKLLGDRQRQRAEVERQLEALKTYRHEYRSRMQTATQTGMAGGDWRNFQQFIDTLDSAIGQQQMLLQQAQDRLEAARREWQAQQRRLNSFGTLATRAQAREDLRVARREQKDNDEYAARATRRRADTSPL